MSTTINWRRRMETSIATFVAIIYYTLNLAKDVKGFTTITPGFKKTISSKIIPVKKQFKKTLTEYSKLYSPKHVLSYSFDVDVDAISTSIRHFGSWYTQVDNPVLHYPMYDNFSEDDTYFTTLNRDFSYYNDDGIDNLNFSNIQSYEKGNESSRSTRNPFRVVKNVVGWAVGRINKEI